VPLPQDARPGAARSYPVKPTPGGVNVTTRPVLGTAAVERWWSSGRHLLARRDTTSAPGAAHLSGEHHLDQMREVFTG